MEEASLVRGRERRFECGGGEQLGATSRMGRLSNQIAAKQTHEHVEHAAAENGLDDNERNYSTLNALYWIVQVSVIASNSLISDQSPRRMH